MLHRIIWIALLIALVVLDGSAFGSSGRDPVSATSPGISQLVENRKGQVYCWGVVVQLSNMTFKRSIGASQIRIVEAKHGHNLTDSMVWSVGKKGKRLTISFKKNADDFGTGNVVQIDIDRSAFLGPIESGNLKFEWSITTDLCDYIAAEQLACSGRAIASFSWISRDVECLSSRRAAEAERWAALQSTTAYPATSCE